MLPLAITGNVTVLLLRIRHQRFPEQNDITCLGNFRLSRIRLEYIAFSPDKQSQAFVTVRLLVIDADISLIKRRGINGEARPYTRKQ